jgi:hypothetical protein
LAFGTFSPLSILSAPTAFPFAGQPYFGRKTEHEYENAMKRKSKPEARMDRWVVFIRKCVAE